MPSLSTLHRCGRSTDEMLIVAQRRPSQAFLPLLESGRSSRREQTSGSGQAQAARSYGGNEERKGERLDWCMRAAWIVCSAKIRVISALNAANG